MKDRIGEIRERAGRATAGPWVLASVDIKPEDRDSNGVGRLWTITEPQEGQTIRRGPIGRKSPNTDAVIDGAGYDADGIYGSTPDLDFIAHSREDIPALLAYIDSLERVREAAKKLEDGPWPEIGSNYPEWPEWISNVDELSNALAAADGGEAK